MHIHSDFLTASSPAEGKVRSLEGNCSPWRMRASIVVKFALVLMVRSVWQISEVVSMKLLHVVKQKFDAGPKDLDKLCLVQVQIDWDKILDKFDTGPKYGSFAKTRFFSKN